MEGQWWTRPDAFKGFGTRQSLVTKKCDYLGGFPEYAETHLDTMWELEVGKSGLRYHSTQSTYTYPDGRTDFTFPWDQVAGIEFDGPEQMSKKFSWNRFGSAAAISVVGSPVAGAVLLLKSREKIKSTVITVRLTSGDELFFQTRDWLAHDLKAKMAPVLSQLPKLQPNATQEVVNTNVTTSVPDDIRKLAELRDSGILTEAEFQAKKTELLARM